MATLKLTTESSLGRQLDLRKSGYRTGRGREAWPPMPKYDNRQIDAVATWMQAHRENRRPLSVAAPLLTIVCALAENNHHLPTRSRLAAEIGCTKDGIDAALSTAIAYGEITERHVTLEGAVAKRRSTRRLRYVDPSPALLAAYRGEKPRVVGNSPEPKIRQKSIPSPWRGVLATLDA